MPAFSYNRPLFLMMAIPGMRAAGTASAASAFFMCPHHTAYSKADGNQ